MDNEETQFIKKEAELEDAKEFLRKIGEEKGIDNFFLEIIRNEDSLKIGNLEENELGMGLLPVRTLKELERDCAIIPSMSSFEEDFKEQANVMIASSLSKEGFLIKARITQKKEMLDDKRKKRRRGFRLFGKKEEED